MWQLPEWFLRKVSNIPHHCMPPWNCFVTSMKLFEPANVFNIFKSPVCLQYQKPWSSRWIQRKVLIVFLTVFLKLSCSKIHVHRPKKFSESTLTHGSSRYSRFSDCAWSVRGFFCERHDRCTSMVTKWLDASFSFIERHLDEQTTTFLIFVHTYPSSKLFCKYCSLLQKYLVITLCTTFLSAFIIATTQRSIPFYNCCPPYKYVSHNLHLLFALLPDSVRYIDTHTLYKVWGFVALFNN